MKWLWLICVMLCGTYAHADSAWERDKAVHETRVDLDGDGKREHIRLVPFKSKISRYWSSQKYRLLVNDQVIFDHCDNLPNFYIADIDRNDRWKEIVVQGYVLPDNTGGQLFSFTDKKLRRVHQQTLVNPAFQGNGIVTDMGWNGFWASQERYRLNAQQTLTWLPQKFHRVGVTKRLNKAMALHSYQQINTVVAVLPVATAVEITRSDLKGWYEVRAPHGTRGWVTESELVSHMQIAMAG